MKIGKHAGGSEWLIPDAGYVKAIKFYDRNGVWYHHDAGWLEHSETPEKYGTTQRVASVEIAEPKRRIKEDAAMAKCENFWMRKKAGYSFEKDGATLYIYAQKVSPDTVFSGESDTRTDYVKRLSIPLVATLDDGNVVSLVKVVMRGSGLHRLTAFGELVQKLDNAFSLDGVPVTGSDVATLLRLYRVERVCPVENVVREEESGREFKEFTDAEIAKLQDERAVHRWAHGSTRERNVFTVSASFKTQHGSGWVEALQKLTREV